MEAACRRRVEGRRAHERQLPVPDVEGVAGVEPAHAVQRQFGVEREAPDDAEVRDQGRVRAPGEDDSRLPVWSWSSWDRKIHRTSSGSTTEKACSSQASRTSAEPVSTSIGSRPRITRLWAPKTPPVGDAASVGISHVSAATGWAVVGNTLQQHPVHLSLVGIHPYSLE